MEIWDLDEKPYNYAPAERTQWLRSRGYDKGTHPKFRVGQVIQFWTGYNNDIRAQAVIKGIEGGNLYVYNDAFWFPIQDDETRKIVIIESTN